MTNNLTFSIPGDSDLDVFDMGEGCIVLRQQNEQGKVNTIALSLDQLHSTVATLDLRYGSKNTDRACGSVEVQGTVLSI